MSLPPVLFILPQTDAAANGGIASISEVIARLREHRPVIVTNKASEQVEQWRTAGIETHVLPLTRSIRDPVGILRTYWRYAREVRRLIAHTGAKVVHANNPFALQLALAAARLSAGTKVVLNLRDTLDPARTPSRTRYRILFGVADHVFFLSQDMADRWAAVAPNAKRAFSVTYSIVDPQRFAPAPPYAGNGPPVVLLSGIIRAKKGQLEFIRHVSPLLAAQGVETWLAGDFDPDSNPYMAGLLEGRRGAGRNGEVPRISHRCCRAHAQVRRRRRRIPPRRAGSGDDRGHELCASRRQLRRRLCP